MDASQSSSYPSGPSNAAGDLRDVQNTSLPCSQEIIVGMNKTDVQRILGDPTSGQWEDNLWSYQLTENEFLEAEYVIYFDTDTVTKVEKRLKDSRVKVEGLW